MNDQYPLNSNQSASGCHATWKLLDENLKVANSWQFGYIPWTIPAVFGAKSSSSCTNHGNHVPPSTTLRRSSPMRSTWMLLSYLQFQVWVNMFCNRFEVYPNFWGFITTVVPSTASPRTCPGSSVDVHRPFASKYGYFFRGTAAKANLVGGWPTPLKILVSWAIIGNIWKNKKCSKPPTSNKLPKKIQFPIGATEMIKVH